MSRADAGRLAVEAFHLGPWGPPPSPRAPSRDARESLIALYARVDEELAEVAAACEACGECCRFGRTKPVLFASALELAHLLTLTGRPAAEVLPTLDAPDAPWTCPYQNGRACTARAARPLGCRTYFCEAEARRRGELVHAEALKVVRAICREAGYPWWYGPARHGFALFRAVP